MAPQAKDGGASKTKQPITAQSDEVKYKTKYRELKAKIGEIEEDNMKLQLRLLKSKKNIHRLRIERSILYDRLTSTTTPTNPYALHAAHLALLPSASSFTSQNGSHPRPPSVLDPPPYPVQDPAASEAAQSHLVERIRLAALKGGDVFGEIKTHGIAGEPTTTTTTAAAIAPVDDAPMMDVALSVGSGSHLV